MSKLAWLLLPLLAAAAVVLVLVLAGRTPTRLALNVLSSLLLLTYLLATAGLGIFWVANQQLPAFDLALPLRLHDAAAAGAAPGLQLPYRLAGTAAAGGAAPRPDAATGLVAAGAAGPGAPDSGAFWLGLRHGRTELSLASDGPAADTGLALIERFHEFRRTRATGSCGARQPPTGATTPFRSRPTPAGRAWHWTVTRVWVR